MSTRRYAIYTPPVEHLNGKLAPNYVVAHNMPDTDVSGVSYLYGYRHQKRPNVSRYAVRERSRNLSNKPYTPNELRDMQLFADCSRLASQLLNDPQYLPAMNAAFDNQRRYTRIYNYAVATLYSNNGNIPPEWITV